MFLGNRYNTIGSSFKGDRLPVTKTRAQGDDSPGSKNQQQAVELDGAGRAEEVTSKEIELPGLDALTRPDAGRGVIIQFI